MPLLGPYIVAMAADAALISTVPGPDPHLPHAPALSFVSIRSVRFLAPGVADPASPPTAPDRHRRR